MAAMDSTRRVRGAWAILALAFAACDGGKTSGAAGATAPPAAIEGAAAPGAIGAAALATAAAAPLADLSTPKGSLQRQLDLIREGKVEELKGCFTDRQRGKITKEIVAEGKGQLEKMKMPFDDMVSRIEEGERDGKQTARIHMKEGDIVLTTLILTDGRWLSDTIWFR